jgi:phosphatidylethanolamine/phosphatidyl-N-methylethanolamine N-methyltransferase
VIISILPWAPFAPSATTRPLLVTLVESLSDGGAYTQVAYSWTRWAPPARRQVRQLRASFEEVVISETIWRNIPCSRLHRQTSQKQPGGWLTTPPAPPIDDWPTDTQ